MRHFILLLAVLLTYTVSAAEFPFQDGEGVIKAKAAELVKKYQADLGLDADQVANFKEIITGYMVRKAKTKKLNVSDADKNVMIKQLAIQENEDMAALLSKGQYKKYLKSKTKLQP